MQPAPSDTSNSGRHIGWSNDVIDNEGVEKSSKSEPVRAYI